MCKKAYKINDEGFYIEDYMYQKNENLNKDIIITEIQQGLFKPKWDGTKWIEGATTEYIESITAKKSIIEENLIDKLILDNINMQSQIDSLIQAQLGGI